MCQSAAPKRARERNIEAGGLIEDTRLAARVARQFDRFVEARVLRPLGL